MKKNSLIIFAVLSSILLSACSLLTPKESEPLDPLDPHAKLVDGYVYTYSDVTGEATFYGLNGNANEEPIAKYTILSEYEGHPVTRLWRGALAGARIDEVVVPNTVKYIDDGALAGKFRQIDLSEGILELGNGALPDSWYIRETDEEVLPEYTVPSSVKKVGEYAFGYTLNPQSVPSSLEEMAELAFVRTHFGDVIIPEGVTTIPFCAFSGARANSIVIPDSVTTIGKSAFEVAEQVTSIHIGSGVKVIPERCFTSISKPDGFEGQYSLTVTGGESVEEIQEEAFFNCYLKYYPYSNVLKKIGKKALNNVINRDFPDTLYEIGEDALAKGGTTPAADTPNAHVPSSLRFYPDFIFSHSIFDETTVTLDATTYGVASFSDTNLVEINMTHRLVRFKDEAFYGCRSLTKINYDGTKEEFRDAVKNSFDVFSNTPDVTVQCKDGVLIF